MSCWVFCNSAYSQLSSVQLFNREDIRITGGVFKNAEDVDTRYMLELNPDRLLAPFIKEAGLLPKALSYGNWENTGLDGHIGGHYLSALSSMYAATGNTALSQRLDYMLAELKRCQDHLGTGYIGGIPGGVALWKEVAAGKISAQSFSLNKKWVPLYNIHKLFAGLYDAYQYAYKQRAKEMLIRLADWWLEISKNLGDEQMETMLRAEFGGMNEAFANVYKISPDTKYLKEAARFAHKAILEPLLNKEDKLNGLHANTQIPKVIGYQQVGLITNNEPLMNAGNFFWENVVNERSVVIGGNSTKEMFNPKNDFTKMLLNKEGPETCNTYNMLKLTRLLYNWHPSAHYIDFYERATYNHILSTQHPQKGGFVYFTSMRPQHYRNYSQVHQGFWCCVGSGLENHSKYGELIYAHTDETVLVNLFIPSTLSWKEKGISIEQRTNFPYESKSSLLIRTAKPGRFTIAIRQPAWLRADMVPAINGKKVNNYVIKDQYLYINHQWKDKDVLSFNIPMKVQVTAMPDKSPWVAFTYGPVVLAATHNLLPGDACFADSTRMGHIADGQLLPLDATPSIRFDTAKVEQYIRLKNNEKLLFSMKPSGTAEEILLQPFSQVHEARYTLYWPLQNVQSGVKEREQQQLLVERMSVDRIALGEQQPESDHGFTFSKTESGILNDMNWRSTSGYLAYYLHNKKGEGRSLVIRYLAENIATAFNVYFNDSLMKTVPAEVSNPPQVKSVVIPLNAELMKSLADKKIAVKITSVNGKETPKLVEIRLSRE